MSDVPLLLIVFWAALNPPALLASLGEPFAALPERRRGELLAAAFALAAALLLLAVLLHEPLLDLLEVSPPSFDVAAGIVMLVASLRPLMRGRAIEEATAAMADGGRRSAVAPLALPLLATPAAFAAAIAYAARAGEPESAVVAIALVALAALSLVWQPQLLARVGRAPIEGLARLSGALLVAVAVGLIVDGVLSI